MDQIINSLVLAALFALLGLSAELMVRHIKYLAKALRMKLFSFGLLLGIITSIPEISVGINATVDGAPGLSVGNLLGGIMVMIGLVLGVSLILHRKINTEGDLKIILPQLAIILLPLLLGLDGKIAQWEGILMLLAYFSLVFYLFRVNRPGNGESLVLIEKARLAKAVMFSLAAIVAIILISHWIVQITLGLLEHWNVGRLTTGLLIFSLGTNLPEISIALTAWRRRSSELSLSHLVSSAFTNVLIFGILAAIKPMSFAVGGSYYILGISLPITLGLFLWFYLSRRRLERWEGLALLFCYLAFIGANIFIISR